MKGIFLKLMFNILKMYMIFIMIYNFYQKKLKIRKVEKLVANLHDKTEYVIHIINLKQALNHGLVLKKVDRVITFNQKALLKPYINMSTELRKKAKNDFGKTIKNVRRYSDTKLVTAEKRKIYLVSDPNYHTKMFSTETLLTMETIKNLKCW